MATDRSVHPEPSTIRRGPLAWLAIALIVLRDPRLFVFPRFWAEEGITYFQYALDHGARETLTATHFGYYAFVPNFGTWLASSLPLAWAPFATLVVAAAVQLMASWLVIDDTALFDSRTKKVLALLALTLPLQAREVWLNTINTQFWLGLVALLCVVCKPASKSGVAVGTLGVLLGAATGPVTAMFAPAFLLRAARDRNARFAALGSVLLVAAMAHFFVLRGERTFQVAPLATVSALFVQSIAVPITGRLAIPIGEFVSTNRSWAGPQIALVFAVAMGWLLRRSSERGRWLLVAGLAAGALAIVGALDEPWNLVRPVTGLRYLFLPSVAMLLTCVATLPRDATLARPTRLAVAWLVGVGVFLAVRSPPLGGGSGRRWRAEVAAYQRDPGDSIAMLPNTHLAPNSTSIRRRFHVEPIADVGGVRARIEIPLVDRGAEGDLYLVAVAPNDSGSLRFFDGQRWVASSVFLFGGGELGTPGLAWGSLVPTDAFIPIWHGELGATHEVAIDPAAIRSLPPSSRLFVGYGRDAADALAKGTFASVSIRRATHATATGARSARRTAWMSHALDLPPPGFH